MPSRRSTPVSRPLQAPVVPAELPAASGVQLDIEHEQTVEGVAYDGAELADLLAERVEFVRARFRKTRFAGSHLAHVRFADCVIEASDLSNLQAEKGSIERVRFDGCRMTGMAWNDALIRDAAFTGCKADLANWRFARLDVVSFDGCNLSGADFANADLRGARFTNCDLSGAQFHHAKLAGARFRACELQGIGGVTDWAGAIVHPDDLLGLAYVLAGALGIRIQE